MIVAIQNPGQEYHWCSKLVTALFQNSSIIINSPSLRIYAKQRVTLITNTQHAKNLSQHLKFIREKQPIDAREVENVHTYPNKLNIHERKSQDRYPTTKSLESKTLD
jgi:hypothetical protein